jgi:hypothetical protein
MNERSFNGMNIHSVLPGQGQEPRKVACAVQSDHGRESSGRDPRAAGEVSRRGIGRSGHGGELRERGRNARRHLRHDQRDEFGWGSPGLPQRGRRAGMPFGTRGRRRGQLLGRRRGGRRWPWRGGWRRRFRRLSPGGRVPAAESRRPSPASGGVDRVDDQLREGERAGECRRYGVEHVHAAVVALESKVHHEASFRGVVQLRPDPRPTPA